LINQLFIIFYNDKEIIFDYKSIVIEMLILREFRGYDSGLLFKID